MSRLLLVCSTVPGSVFLAAAALRLALIVFGEWQDANLEVAYTDVDYHVFSDAARMIKQGGSPYDRPTYRYTPLLAWGLLPNISFHPAWGKTVFSVFDLVVGWISFKMLQDRGCSAGTAIAYVAVWLFNPFTVPIGTRGNCEALVSALLLIVVHSLINRRVILAAVVYGLAVHMRLYPIIYALSMVLFLDKNYPQCSRNYLNRSQIRFTLVSAFTFLALGALCYRLYGESFLQETYLYHITRSDPRHNFSLKWYTTYLNHASPSSKMESLVGFLLQGTVMMVLSLAYAQDISFCMFVTTFAFVAFNKV